MTTPTLLLETATNAQLVAAFNAAIADHSLDVKPTKKFSSAAGGRARILRLAETYGLDVANVNGELALVQPDQEQQPADQEVPPAPEVPLAEQIEQAAAARIAAASAKKTAKKAKKTGGRRGPAPEYADDDVITLNVAYDKKTRTYANPKKPGSKAHARFALYSDGMTVGAFLAAGGTREDLRWDSKHGHITTYTARQWANSEAGRDIEDDGKEA